ncbi:sodium:proton antiporter [Allopusillimonas soli]|uniref:Sodium:proton antiporter n=1 Tax=Allopusillimonas soli TaxID=659016 RepID=A0A853FAL4_9BURK|nr:sodium:proton antiporter [Allopusillimonas soli]NYT35601.1 sodium:proton antiporter [Allopusillimonas soli]TEA76003.1 sodium:proton antiporter [Allopusillimonas soli]
MGEHNVLMLAGIGVVGMFCQWLAWRMKLPAILFLLLAGLALGPLAGILDPDALFGELLFPFISLSVAVILFEGSLTLTFQEIRGVERVVRRLVTTGVVITGGITTCAVHWIMDFPWELAFLFGAITVVTGPTVIAPLLRTVRPVARVASTLRWEGIIIDPIGALLAVLAYEFIIALHNTHAWDHALLVFGETVLVGALAGVTAGWAVSEMLRRHWLADYLLNITVLALVFAVFAISNEIQHESGLLAVTIMGIWMANRQGVPVEEILEFKETLTLMLLSGLFIILAARMDLASLQALGWRAIAVLAIMLFVARPLKVLFAAWNSPMPWRERALLAWIAPRGIVAAAVSALFALKLESLGLPHAEQLLPLTFLVIIGTVILQSATARPIAVALGLGEPEPTGFLIVGANPLARAVATALKAQDVPVRLCDSDWDSISKARMEGLPTYYGNPISEHAHRNLDLAGLGRMLALGAWDNFNELVTARFHDEFGKNNVYALPEASDNGNPDKHRAAARHRGRNLFSPQANYWTLSTLLARGGKIRATTLTDSYGFDDYVNGYENRQIPLFALNPKGIAEPFTLDATLSPQEGWTVLSLFPPDVEARRQDEKLAHNGNGK